MDAEEIERCHRLIRVHTGTLCTRCSGRRTWPSLTGSGSHLFLCIACDECGHVASTPWAPPPR